MKQVFVSLVLISLFCHPKIVADFSSDQAVTYTLSGGRFGDNLLAYLHAKWVSYHYNIPMLYKPFPYSNQLVMDQVEMHYSKSPLRYNNECIVKNLKPFDENQHKKVLFVVPYFAETLWEHSYCPEWGYFAVNWEDKGFRKEIKRTIAPAFAIPTLQLPSDRISVAVHLRRGTGYDTELTIRSLALKFPQDNFYIAEIRWLLSFFKGAPLYVYLFTDDPNPLAIKYKYEDIFRGSPIIFGCRETGNNHSSNVLEDFFALTQFDCAIHGESNFTVTAGKICDYAVEIQPTAFHWEDSDLIMDEVSRNVRKSKLLALCAEIPTTTMNDFKILE